MAMATSTSMRLYPFARLFIDDLSPCSLREHAAAGTDLDLVDRLGDREVGLSGHRFRGQAVPHLRVPVGEKDEVQEPVRPRIYVGKRLAGCRCVGREVDRVVEHPWR